MSAQIPYGRQDISEADVRAVVEVLQSEFLTQGPVVPLFESAVARYCSVEYAVAVNSATSALHLACLALDLRQGDLVWTSPITFVASANCAIYCGASIDFVDIDPLTYNISVERLSNKLEEAKKLGRLPKLVIAVHLCGQPCEMRAIYELSKKYGFKIIEDASHAIGGKYQDKIIGACNFSDITVFSFHPVKIITTGEGGMAVTNDVHLDRRMRLLRSHGITTALSDMAYRPPEEIWNYQQIALGFNYRMTDIQAALGLSQMKRLNNFVSARHILMARYNQLLSFPIITPFQHKDSYSACHLYVVRLQLDEIGKSQRQVYDALRNAGIFVNLHYIPVYLHPYYKKMGFQSGHCPEAEKYFHEAITLPMYSGLTEKEQDFITSSLRDVIVK